MQGGENNFRNIFILILFSKHACILIFKIYLLGPKKMKHDEQVQVYVIRWRPSQCSVDQIEEIILDNNNPKHVIEKVFFYFVK